MSKKAFEEKLYFKIFEYNKHSFDLLEGLFSVRINGDQGLLFHKTMLYYFKGFGSINKKGVYSIGHIPMRNIKKDK